MKLQDIEVDKDQLNRRQQDRPHPPKPSKNVYFVMQTDKLAKNITQSHYKHALAIGVLLVSIYFIQWNMFGRLGSLDHSLSNAKQLDQLQLQLFELKNEWSDDELQEIEESITIAQATIFDDFPALAAWLMQKSTYANKLGLSMTYNLKHQELTELEKTFSIPLEMILKVKPGVTDKVYSRALKFTRSLVDENLHIEIAGNELKSDGIIIQQVRLDVNVWVRDAAAMLDVAQNSSEEEFEVNEDVPFVQ
ncbi:MAG: hypothetical protein JKX75_08145 [Gammaproteobacteria bacterium]|nr:hypothetical protein [Gammaproteobacteria bacterium]